MTAHPGAASEGDVGWRGLRQLALSLTVIAALLFLSAGSLRYWQGWLFLTLMAGFWIFFFIDLLKHDPKLLERRLQSEESAPEQRLFQKLLFVILLPAFVLAGLDFRFGWTQSRLHGVPVRLVLVGQAMAVAAYWLVFSVMKANSFAASTIRVEDEQRVIDSGPYAIVRHPMYFGMALMVLGTPLALGSYVALPVFALFIPLLIFRLTHEEKFLRHALPGYAEYCGRIRFRLIPFLW
jgi:protein-S-isoprenylcysteine O-methyltransferase Ste14